MNFRDDRLKSMFLSEINFALSNREDIKDIAFFTITDVELRDSGKMLYVYFSIIENKDEKILLLTEKLKELSGEVKQIIRKRIRTKFVPNIVFKYDPTPYRAMRVEELFKKIEKEKNEHSEK